MTKATGSIRSARADQPLPSFLVQLHSAGSDPQDEASWRRLGTSYTDRRGDFEVSGSSRGATDRPETLVLVVETTPRAGGQPTRLATEVRTDPGEIERFLIRIDDDVLDALGDDVPIVGRNTATLFGAQRFAQARAAEFDAEADRRLGQSLAGEASRNARAEAEFTKLAKALSGQPELPEFKFRIAPGESVRAGNLAAIREGIEDRVNSSALSGLVALNPTALSQLQDDQGNLLSAISPEALMAIINPKSDFLDLYDGPPLSSLCREDLPRDPCLDLLENDAGDGAPDAGGAGGSDTGSDNSPDPEAPSEPLTDARLAQYLADILAGAESDVPSFEALEQPGNLEDRIQSFSLSGGPADSPAIHDFHHLSIAFDHVWNEVTAATTWEVAKKFASKVLDAGLTMSDVIGDAATPDEVKLRLPGLKYVAENNLSLTPNSSVLQVFEITGREWYEAQRQSQGQNQLSETLSELADAYLDGPIEPEMKDSAKNISELISNMQDYVKALKEAREAHADIKRRGESIIAYLRRSIFEQPRFAQFHQILEDLEKEIRQKYSFQVFGAAGQERAVNFGLMSTYRQTWQPLAYQVGELVQSVPLAPKEVRKFTHKTTVRRKRAQKEVLNNISSLQTERNETTRAETEIIDKARQDSNFKMSASGGFNVGVASASASQSFERSAGADSQDVKKRFRESVFKASQEVREERKLEVELAADEEFLSETSGEISNPNDEISVTYLFYQLQRRYRLSERLHRVQPVVLVAQDVPNPSEIDDDWLISHDWILRRVILDDSFLPALDYLSSRVVGDELALQEMFQNVEQQRKNADALKQQIVDIREAEARRYRELQRAIENRADDSGDEELQILQDAAHNAYDRAARQMRDAETRLQTEISSLNALTETYSGALSDHLNRRTQISRLALHVRQNILHYMQAIWAHEPPDQRFMRLKDVPVPRLTGELSYQLQPDPNADPVPPDWQKPMALVADCKIDDPTEHDPLSKVADIDNVLGFKANYMILRLRTRNVLTDYMMTPYLDAHAGLRDPDPLAYWSLQDFGRYVCCLQKELSEDDFDALRPGLIEAYRTVLAAPRSDDEEIVVPTDSLYIEALPGRHSVLEPFKMLHRAMDVRKVQADIRSDELENVRAAARILAGDLSDPNIDKRIEIDGGGAIVLPEDDS